jgi:hypothetical protein
MKTRAPRPIRRMSTITMQDSRLARERTRGDAERQAIRLELEASVSSGPRRTMNSTLRIPGPPCGLPMIELGWRTYERIEQRAPDLERAADLRR